MCGAAALLLSSTGIAACQTGSGPPSELLDAASSIIAANNLDGWRAETYPSNNSLIDTVDGTPVDFTGSLTRRTTATVVYVSPAATDLTQRQAICSEAISYLRELALSRKAPWQPEEPQIEDCLAGLETETSSGPWEYLHNQIAYTARIDTARNGNSANLALVVSAHLE